MVKVFLIIFIYMLAVGRLLDQVGVVRLQQSGKTISQRRADELRQDIGRRFRKSKFVQSEYNASGNALPRVAESAIKIKKQGLHVLFSFSMI